MDSLLDVFRIPQMTHAAMVHLPIGLAILGVPLVCVVAVLSPEKKAVRWVAVTAYLALAAFGFLATLSGDEAMEQVPSVYPQSVHELVEEHEELGDKVWIFGLVTAAFLALGVAKPQWARKSGTILGLLASFGTAGWVGLTAHHGGMLVYAHAVGPNEQQIVANAGLLAPPAPMPTPVPDAAAQGDDSEAATPGIDVEAAAAVSYTNDIQPIFEESCVRCHGTDETSSGFDASSYPTLLAGGRKAGPAIIPGHPDESPLLQYLTGERNPQMPRRRPPLEDSQIDLIRKWIAAGARNDALQGGGRGGFGRGFFGPPPGADGGGAFGGRGGFQPPPGAEQGEPPAAEDAGGDDDD